MHKLAEGFAAIETERLILRHWQASDREPFALLNADPQVREFFPNRLSAEESDEAIERYQTRIEQSGFGLFAAELKADHDFAGVLGMQALTFAIPSVPEGTVEIGWRLAVAHRGKGLASEGARAVLNFALEQARLQTVIAFTAAANMRSRRGMERIGMVHQPQLGFDHPDLPQGHPLTRHVDCSASRAEQ